MILPIEFNRTARVEGTLEQLQMTSRVELYVNVYQGFKVDAINHLIYLDGLETLSFSK
jgi:hypothetical protein